MDFHAPISNATFYTSNLKAKTPLRHAIRNTNLLIFEPICVSKPTTVVT